MDHIEKNKLLVRRAIKEIWNGVVECWSNMDELSLLQQLGVLPVPENQ